MILEIQYIKKREGLKANKKYVSVPCSYMLSNTLMCVSEAFHILTMITNHYVLFCRLLYRQWFFQTVPKLIENYHHAAGPVRHNFLIALAHTLQGVPRVVLTMSLQEVRVIFLEIQNLHLFLAPSSCD